MHRPLNSRGALRKRASWYRMRHLAVLIMVLIVIAGCTLEQDLIPTTAAEATAPLYTRALPATASQLQPQATVDAVTETSPPTEESSPEPDTPTATITPEPATPTATITPEPAPTMTPPPLRLEEDGSYLWALIGDSTRFLAAEQQAGVEAKVFSLSWRNYEIADGLWDPNYIANKMQQYRQIQSAGMDVILSLGYHDPPAWIHQQYEDTRYVNQYGISYDSQGEIDGGDLNVVWNDEMRAIVERYVDHVFATFGTDFVAVRVGGGRYGELSYPPATYDGQDNAYWAFDENALASNPVPYWRPGEASASNEAAQFLEWYLDKLAEFQNWQIEMVRDSYYGPLMVLYPSWGLRPGDIELALATDLDGSSSPEVNGEVQRGYDFQRHVTALNARNVILTTTWLDADFYPDLEDGDDPRFWSPAHYLAHLAAEHPTHPGLFGENTGQGDAQDMALSAERMSRFGLLGMAWYREAELFSGQYASLEEYQAIILLSEAAATTSD